MKKLLLSTVPFKKFRINSIFSRILLSVFAGVLLVVIISAVIFFNYLYSATKEENKQLTYSYIESVASSASLIISDNLVQEIRHLTDGYYMLQMLYYTAPTDAIINSVLSELKSANSYNIYVDSIVVEIPRHNLVLDSQYRSYATGSSPYEELISFYKESKASVKVESGNQEASLFVYDGEYYLASGFPLQDSYGLATVFIQIDMHQLYRAILKDEPDLNSLYVYDAQGEYVFSKDINYTSIGLSFEELLSLLSSQSEELSIGSHLYLSYIEPSTGWAFVVQENTDQFAPAYGAVLDLLFPILSIVLVGAVLIAIIIVTIIYSPFNRMFATIFGDSAAYTPDQPASPVKNEIDYITYMISEANTTISQMGNMMRNISSDITDRLFADLLNNKPVSYEYVKTSLQSIHTPFQFDNIYVVIAIAFPSDYEIGEIAADSPDCQGIETVLSAFNRRNSTSSYIRIMPDHILAIVISFAANTDINEAHKAIDNLKTLLSGYLKGREINIYCERGHFYHSILDVTASWNRAITCVQQARETGTDSDDDAVISSPSAATPAANDLGDSIRYQVALVVANIGDKKSGETLSIIVRNIINEMVEHKPVEGNAVKSLSSFLTLFTEALDEKNLINADNIEAVRALLQRTEHISTQTENVVHLSEEILTLSQALISDAQERYKTQQNPYLLKAKKYIEENYSDPNLSLEVIAEKCSITPNYLSKLFVSSGSYYSDYISQYRILKSISLLRDSELTINEIAESCGFNSTQSFIRVFKKQMGNTPGKFRKS